MVVKEVSRLKDCSDIDLAREHNAVRVSSKLGQPKEVKFAERDGDDCESRERAESYKTGDAIVKDIKMPGDTKDYYYPVERSRFDKLYEPLDKEKGRYVERKETLLAMKINEPFSAKRSTGEVLPGKAGDWLLQATDGSHLVVGEEVFKKTYEIESNILLTSDGLTHEEIKNAFLAGLRLKQRSRS